LRLDVPDIDLTHPKLPDGRYDAQIDAVEFKFYDPKLICIGFRVPFKGVSFYVWDEQPIAASPKSASYPRIAQGKYRVHQILDAFGEKPPPTASELDLEETLVGREVLIEIRNTRGDIPTPKVAKVLGKARQPVPASHE
jgi:hypothetical protein